ncbi:MAG: hypothetical protein RIR92_1041 [Pseudomonadota bacterium]|jgi:hypothetical protein
MTSYDPFFQIFPPFGITTLAHVFAAHRGVRRHGVSSAL